MFKDNVLKGWLALRYLKYIVRNPVNCYQRLQLNPNGPAVSGVLSWWIWAEKTGREWFNK